MNIYELVSYLETKKEKFFSVPELSQELNIEPKRLSKSLSRLVERGQLKRVRRRYYAAPDALLDIPSVACEIYKPSFLAGPSAAAHWKFLDQSPSTVTLMTSKKMRHRIEHIGGSEVRLITIPKSDFFGLVEEERENRFFQVSGPARTVIDFLHMPQLATHVDVMVTVFKNYMQSEHRDFYTLVRYAKNLGNGAILKRLGFLTETLLPSESALIEACKIELTQGHAALHPCLEKTRLSTFWRLRISEELFEKSEKLKISKKKGSLKKGYTTGACATASAMAAAQALITGKVTDQVTITLPIGEEVTFPVEICRREGSGWYAAVRKDAGDDPDVTHLAIIGARVKPKKEQGIELSGGKGVGTVTKPGLGLVVGAPAINPVPKKMIQSHLHALHHKYAGLDVEISIPNGEVLAKKTLNERLGIVGGLSILGTTGIVKPFSTAAYRASIVQAIKVAVEMGHDHLVFTTGGKSERYAQKIFSNFSEEAFVQMGDFVGAAVKSAVNNKAKQITLCGMVGKISKIANRKDMTHAAGSEVNMELMAQFAADCGASEQLCQNIKNANTARHVGEIVSSSGLKGFYDRMCRAAAEFVFLEIAQAKLIVEIIITHLETGKILGRYIKKI